MKTHIDHLIVVAKTLQQGVQWCEATLGITPGPGVEHAQQGTHNRLFKIATPSHPLAYFEIVAIDPGAKKSINPLLMRYFDMDDPALQAAVAAEPRLVHFVASTTELQAVRVALKAQGIDRGPALPGSRHSRRGVLHWHMTVRDDGQRLFDGTLPTLMQWGKADAAEPLRLHPRNTLPRSGVTLHSLSITHPTAPKLQAAYDAMGLSDVAVEAGPANLMATLNTPKGLVTLHSHGI